jgi:hypothetical protein
MPSCIRQWAGHRAYSLLHFGGELVQEVKTRQRQLEAAVPPMSLRTADEGRTRSDTLLRRGTRM